MAWMKRKCEESDQERQLVQVLAMGFSGLMWPYQGTSGRTFLQAQYEQKGSNAPGSPDSFAGRRGCRRTVCWQVLAPREHIRNPISPRPEHMHAHAVHPNYAHRPDHQRAVCPGVHEFELRRCCLPSWF